MLKEEQLKAIKFEITTEKVYPDKDDIIHGLKIEISDLTDMNLDLERKLINFTKEINFEFNNYEADTKNILKETRSNTLINELEEETTELKFKLEQTEIKKKDIQIQLNLATVRLKIENYGLFYFNNGQ